MEIKELFKKPVAMMTGEELSCLLSCCIESANHSTIPTNQAKRFVYGLKGIAEIFGCSVPTANRIKASGLIDEAITQVGRKIIVDAEKALELVNNHKQNDYD